MLTSLLRLQRPLLGRLTTTQQILLAPALDLSFSKTLLLVSLIGRLALDQR
jgi:hypothetical protein